MDIVKAPGPINCALPRPWLFLAGSIEQGKAVDWQNEIGIALKDTRGTILNPRRDDWDSSWEQRASFEPFRQQVSWEQMAIHAADFVFFYFSDGTQSPISLMELGQCAECRPNTTMVRCTPNFWRIGNVEIVCDQAKVPIALYHDNSEAILALKSRLTAQHARIASQLSQGDSHARRTTDGSTAAADDPEVPMPQDRLGP